MVVSLPTENGIFHHFSMVNKPFLAPKSIISTGTRVSEDWQSATDNQKLPSLVSELTTFIDGILSKLLFKWVKKGSIYINFLFETKWRSTTWFTPVIFIFSSLLPRLLPGKIREENVTSKFPNFGDLKYVLPEYPSKVGGFIIISCHQ